MERDLFGTGGADTLCVTAAELAHIFGVQPNAISHMAKDGMPKAGRNRYNLIECVQWDRQQWKLRAERASNVSNRPERARYFEAQAKRAELEIAERSGELIDIAKVERTMAAMAEALVSGMEALPARVASELAELSTAGEIQDRIYAECHRIRDRIYAALADGGIVQTNGAADPTTAKPNGGGVGRQRAGVATG